MGSYEPIGDYTEEENELLRDVAVFGTEKLAVVELTIIRNLLTSINKVLLKNGRQE